MRVRWRDDRHCLERHRVTPDYHYELTRLAIKKRYRHDCSAEDFEAAFAIIASDIHQCEPGSR